MRNTLLYSFLLTSIALLVMVLGGFAIREQLSPENHSLYPVTFLILFTLNCILAYRLMKRSRFIHGFQPLSMILFISLGLYLLYSISSVNRKNEIRNYFAENEQALTRIKDLFMISGSVSVKEIKEEMRLDRIYFREGLFNVRLYTCLGYGYGVLYSDRPDIEGPEKLGGSPVVKWMKLKDHWYYYSIFD